MSMTRSRSSGLRRMLRSNGTVGSLEAAVGSLILFAARRTSNDEEEVEEEPVVWTAATEVLGVMAWVMGCNVPLGIRKHGVSGLGSPGTLGACRTLAPRNNA